MFHMKPLLETYLKVFFALLHITQTFGGSPHVTIQQGELVGLTELTRQGREIESYKGIRYANVPRRFDVSVPAKPWKGVFNATKYGEWCLQVLEGKLPKEENLAGGEDCLFINVHTPSSKIKGKYSVIVWIHGGAFQLGAGELYGPKYFLDEEVVLVTFNYRVGTLGFLTTGDNEVSGNAGLKDQHLALKWVKNNIEAFGGNPNKITIMGESAGGCSVSLQVLYLQNEGLFHSAIMQSGAALNPWCASVVPVESTGKLAEKLGCKNKKSKTLVSCLRKKDAKQLVLTAPQLAKWHFDPVVPFGPTIERNTVKNPFLTEHPLKLLKEGTFLPVPLIMGVNKDEGLLFHAFSVLLLGKHKQLFEEWDRVAPITLYFDESYSPHLTGEERHNISMKIKDFYFGAQEINFKTMRDLVNMYSDRLFKYGVYKTALYYSNKVPVFMFQMDYFTPDSFTYLKIYFKDAVNETTGVSHGDDLHYFFNAPTIPPFKSGSRSEQVSKDLVHIWSSFAKFNEPRAAKERLNLTWPPINECERKTEALQMFYMADPPRVSYYMSGHRVMFWDTFLDTFSDFNVLKYLKM